MASTDVQLVIFDIGGVLCIQGFDVAAAAAVLGAEPAALEAGYWAGRDRYDRGCSSTAYWAGVAAASGAPRPEPGAVAQLVELDCQRWRSVAGEVSAMLDSLARRGCRLGLLSNAPKPLAETVRAASWSAGFEHRVFSSDLGLMKPDPRCYQVVLARFGVPAASAAFFDDRPENVAAAAQLGIQAQLFPGAGGVQRIF